MLRIVKEICKAHRKITVEEILIDIDNHSCAQIVEIN